MTGLYEPEDLDPRERSAQLFDELATLADHDVRRGEIRDELVRLHLPLVEHLAARFRDRGEPFDDLVQVGTIGLINAVDRFDADRGVKFSSFATPTILGEIKRHFRDKGWTVRVPRRVQELRLSVVSVTSELSQSLGRSPRVAEIAERLGASQEEVLEVLESGTAYAPVSLDAPEPGDPEGPSRLDTLGVEDEALDDVENREVLFPLLARLDPRERRIIGLRFFRGMTQSQIATEIGISQMHVSRLLSRTLAQLREDLTEDNAAS